MRRLGVALALALVAALGLGIGIAVAAFTVHVSTPQTVTAADSFRPQPSVELKAESRTNDRGASSSQVHLGLRLRNIGDDRIDLDTVTMRYWFTSDGGADPIPACYYASFGCGKLDLDVVELPALREDADHYLQVTFTSGRLGHGETAQLDQLAFRDPYGSVYRQDNDHSFVDQGSFAVTERVTVYIGGTLVWGTEPTVVPAHDGVEVSYANRDSSPHDGAIMFTLSVLNTGTGSLDLRRLTLRYWFTKESGSETLLGYCDYAQIGCGKVVTGFGKVEPPRSGADRYVEVGFGSGSLALAGSTGPIQLRIHKSDYSPFDETNDHSRGTNTSLGTAERVTAYIDGALVWGTEP